MVFETLLARTLFTPATVVGDQACKASRLGSIDALLIRSRSPCLPDGALKIKESLPRLYYAGLSGKIRLPSIATVLAMVGKPIELRGCLGFTWAGICLMKMPSSAGQRSHLA